MKHFKVLGSGCKNCETTANLLEAKARELDIDIEVEKVTDMAAIMGYGVMSTPGVVLEEKVIHAGGVPKPDKVVAWLQD